MRPEEKLLLEVDSAFDRHYSKLTAWEVDFLTNVKKLLSHPRSTASVKQKNMARALIKKLDNQKS